MRVTDAKLLTNIYTDAKLLGTAAAAQRLPRIFRPDTTTDTPTDKMA